MAYDQRQRIEELGRQITVGSQLNTAWHDGGMDNPNAMAAGRIGGLLGDAQGEEQGEGLQRQRPRHAAGYAGQDPWPSRPGEQQFAWEPPRVVADAGRNGRRQDESRRESEGRATAEWVGQAALGNPGGSEWRPRTATGNICDGSTEWPQEAGRSTQSGQRQTQSPLGRDADGPADWLDDAELYTTCDNRTDELRLLGNGVVPACAERAFRLLVGELMEHQP